MVRRGIVDIGSGSVLLLVAEGAPGAWRPILETSEVTSLGEGAKQSGRLGVAGIKRTLTALARARDAARELGVDQLEAYGTMALRIADNREEFVARAAEIGVEVRVLSADDEARLGFLAIADDPQRGAFPRLTVIDPGGQSTELIRAHREDGEWRIDFQRSFPIGTLQLRGGRLHDPSPDAPALLTASTELDDLIGPQTPVTEDEAVVAVGAPGTDLAMIRDGRTVWDRNAVDGAYLDYEEIGKAVGWLSPMTDVERSAVPGVTEGRGPTIHIGCLMLERFLYAIAAPGCTVSVAGWRYALLDHAPSS